MKKIRLRNFILPAVAVLSVIIGIKGYALIDQYIPKKENRVQNAAAVRSSDIRSAVFVNGNTDGTDDGFEKLIFLMKEKGRGFYKTSSETGIIGNDDVIILKVNSQWNQRGGTNVDLVESVIKAIVNHPDGFTGEIIIADNGQKQFGSKNKGGSLDWAESNGKDRTRSMLDLSKIYKSMGYKVSAYSWDAVTTRRVSDFDDGDMNEGFVVNDSPDTDTGITVSYPKFISESGTYISFKKGVWDREKESFNSDILKIINMPVLKTHMQYGVTGAVKSYMGVPSDKLTRNSHSTIGLGSMGTLMAATRIPALTVMDAIYINANTDVINRGPSTAYDDATFSKTVLASTDPVALDYYAAGEVLYPAVEASGDRVTRLNDRDNTEPGSFGYWLRLSMWQLQKSGFKCVIDENRIDVYEVEQR